jgi:hypothetical protein
MALTSEEKSLLLSMHAAGELSFHPSEFYVNGKP